MGRARGQRVTDRESIRRGRKKRGGKLGEERPGVKGGAERGQRGGGA